MNDFAKTNVNAKINLSLNILSRSQGYHCLDMVVASVNLSDAVSVRLREDKKITVSFEKSSSVCCDEIDKKNNSALTAARLFQTRFDTVGMDILIEKNIPICGGLGGSSADAAGVLRVLEHLCGQDKHASQTALKAFEVGSDTEYMKKGGFARVFDRGERVVFLNNFSTFFAVLAMGKSGVSTAQSFALFDKKNPSIFAALSDNDELLEGLKRGDVFAVSRQLGNALLEPSAELNPEILTTLDLLKQSGAIAVNMSGSGAVCFGLFQTESDSQRAEGFLKKKLPFAKAVKTTSQATNLLGD